MVTWEKYGRDRHKPAGEWVQTTHIEKVTGVAYCKTEALAFSKAAKKAERQGCIYGVRLELEPENPVDKNAVMVWGVAESRGWLGGIKQAEWHIGYLSAALAAELHRDLLSMGRPIAAELYSIFEDGEFFDFNIIILAPKGFGVASRDRAARKNNGAPETLIEKCDRLIFEDKFDEAINLLLDCCDQVEAHSRSTGHGVAPWCYERLTTVFRKMKLPDEEIAILERYDRQLKSPGEGPEKLAARLKKLRSEQLVNSIHAGTVIQLKLRGKTG